MTGADAGGLQRTTLGGLSLFDVPFPVAIGDRYIHLRFDADEPICQVWRWDGAKHLSIREPDPGEAGLTGLRLDRQGDGSLSLSVTTEPEQALVSGDLAVDDLRIVCNHDELQVWRGDLHQITVRGSSLRGGEVGLHVTTTGVSMGSFLPPGFKYQLDYVRRRVRLAQMVDPRNPWLRNARFVSCELEGPAILAAYGPDVVFEGGEVDLLGAPEDALFLRRPANAIPMGMIALENVLAQDCVLVGVAVVVPE